ncbi:MAG: hypothetical protein HQK97_10120 [Nitrospirae bacterium]|nr:hypothetical protein [Nitrospirota bacterium]
MRTKLYIAAVMAGLFIFGQGVHAFSGNGSKMPHHFGGNSLVVGSDGTSYVASANIASATSMTSMTSNLIAITSAGSKQSITVNGLVKKFVIGQDTSSNNYLIATAMVKSSTTTSPSTVLYITPLPFSQSSTPTSVSLTGAMASRPQIVNGNIYITTTLWSASTTGGASTKTSYLNVVGFNGSIVSQVSY